MHLLSVIPEWFYQESKLFKGKSLWIPTSSSPRQSLSRGPEVFKNKRKNLDSRLKISGMTEKEVVTPECFYQGSRSIKTKDKRLKKEPNSPLTTIRLQDKIKGEIF